QRENQMTKAKLLFAMIYKYLPGWRTTWSHVVGGFASGTSVLFYEETTGHCEIYQLTYNPEDSGTDVNSLGSVASVELPGASIIVGGSFGLDPGYALYFPESGLLQFLFVVDFSQNSINTDDKYRDAAQRHLRLHVRPERPHGRA